MKNFKNYIFVITAVVFGIAALFLALKLFNLEQKTTVKLNNSSFGKEVSKIVANGKNYVAIEELDGILGIDYEISEDEISIVTEDELHIDEALALEIADAALTEDWGDGGRRYIEERSTVKVTMLDNGSYKVERSPIRPEGVFSAGGGYRVFVGKEGRVLINHVLD